MIEGFPKSRSCLKAEMRSVMDRHIFDIIYSLDAAPSKLVQPCEVVAEATTSQNAV